MGALLSGSNVQFKCDNTGVVESINKGSSKEQMVMHLLRCLLFFSAYFSITITACHIPVLNTDADQLSRNRAVVFLNQNPHVATIPATIPMPLLKLVSPKRKQDWTSLSFQRIFK